MDFITRYQSCARSNRMVNIDSDPLSLVPNVYSYPEQGSAAPARAKELLRLLAGGNIQMEYPSSFSFLPMDCCLLLYTSRGGGRLTHSSSAITIEEQQLALFDCRHPFSLHSFVIPWHFRLFFIDGRDLELFRSLLGLSSGLCAAVPEYSRLRQNLNTLLSLDTCPDTFAMIQMHQNLTDILCSLCPPPENGAGERLSSLPPYLIEMRDFFEHQYARSFSLEQFEEQFHVSRYRLCREFSAAYKMPPLQYQIHKRMKEAKKMLLTTDDTIREISSKVGYDNVNHFIHLFKKNTGMTPGAFRQKVREERSASHCSAR